MKLRDVSVEANSGVDDRQRTIAECGAAAVARSLPVSPNVRISGEHAANVLESSRAHWQPGKRNAVEDDVGDQRPFHLSRTDHAGEREIERQRSGGRENAPSRAVTSRGIERQALREIPEIDVGIRCPSTLVHRIAQSSAPIDRGIGARYRQMQRGAVNAFRFLVSLQCPNTVETRTASATTSSRIVPSFG